MVQGPGSRVQSQGPGVGEGFPGSGRGCRVRAGVCPESGEGQVQGQGRVGSRVRGRSRVWEGWVQGQGRGGSRVRGGVGPESGEGQVQGQDLINSWRTP